MLGRFAEGWEGYEARWIEGKSLAEALGARYPAVERPGRAPRARAGHQRPRPRRHHPVRPLPAADGSRRRRAASARARPSCTASSARWSAAASSSASPRAPASTPRSPFPACRAPSGRALDTIPRRIPYLAAEPERIPRWAAQIGAQGFRIGCVWQGNANPEADISRSFLLNELAPLAAVPGVRLVSLQTRLRRGAALAEPAGFPDPAPVRRASTSAAPPSSTPPRRWPQLDLVVTCDTSIAHLAGALGRPVWVALKQNAEWRWLRDREDSPWYPTMRLFRQPAHGDWASVFAAMADALRASRISA